MLTNPAYSHFEGRAFIYVFVIFRYVVLLIGLLLQCTKKHFVQKTWSPRHSGWKIPCHISLTCRVCFIFSSI